MTTIRDKLKTEQEDRIASKGWELHVEDGVPRPSKDDIISGLTKTDLEYFQKRMDQTNSEELRLTKAWLSKINPYPGSKPHKIGKTVREVHPDFWGWFINGIPKKRRSYINDKHFAQFFEARLQNYVTRTTRHNEGAPIYGQVVYVVGNNENTSVCKIGTSTNPKKRFGSIQVSFPWDLYVFKLYRGEGERFEYRLHELFRRHHIRGEWFNYTPEVKKVIEPNTPTAAHQLDLYEWNWD